MRDFRDAKAMAQALRAELAPKSVALSHSECLEIIAKIFGAKDWNVLSAVIESSVAPNSLAAASVAADRWFGPLLLSRDFVLFPKQVAPLFIARDISKKAMAEASRGGFEVLLVAQKEPQEEDPRRDGIYDVGVVADVLEMADAKAGEAAISIPAKAPRGAEMILTLRGRQRAKIVAVADEGGCRYAEARLIRSEPVDEAAASARVRAAIEAFKGAAPSEHLRSLGADLRSRITARAENTTQPGALADLIAQLAPGSVAAKQSVLEIEDELLRLEAAVALLRA